MPSKSAGKTRVSGEVLNIGGAALAVLTVVAMGAGLSAALPTPSPWLTAAAYLAPAGLGFAAYWWVAQKL
jgi:hypothetical protein